MSEIYFSLVTGLSIGFLGSVHCIGMCGPIALALPVHTYTGWHKFSSIALYNLGRSTTYAALGLVFGFLGSRFQLWGFQQVVSVGAGILILLFILSNFSLSSRLKWLGKFNGMVQQSLGKLLKSPKRTSSFLSIGLWNGLLPCGLVYVAMAAALATTDTAMGAFLMFAFGLGTIPVMAGMMVFGHLISLRFRQKLNRAVPVFVGMLAILLILRGMNMGIPLLSPKMDKHTSDIECCHKPS